ncbi:hypothetical protein [Chloroflexus sp.]|nr:hypothetical protein [Chloroflexus sp.]
MAKILYSAKRWGVAARKLRVDVTVKTECNIPGGIAYRVTVLARPTQW